jgi:NAD(P)-dependent dehydrogenase (short-subunit alcohol dehydrogenase family)
MRSASITGAATGIGEALVVRLQREGWQVFAAYRNSSPDRTRWFGLPNVIAVRCDVTDPDQVVAAASTVAGHTGGTLDLLINNAGYSPREGVIEAASMTEYACVRGQLLGTGTGGAGNDAATAPVQGADHQHNVGIGVHDHSHGLRVPDVEGGAQDLHPTPRMELAPFGIEVTNLEPGGVDTAMTETGPEAGVQQWALIPEPLREQYRRHFLDGATAIGDNFTFEHPDAFADAVWKRIVCAKRLRPSYLIGPKVAVLPWLHRLLPAQQVEKIWRRMFSRKPGA